MSGYKHSLKEKMRAILLLKNNEVRTVARKMRVSERTLFRWKSMYDGSDISLENRSCRPKSAHPNSHTKQEKKRIISAIKKYPNFGYLELWWRLKSEYGYRRTFGGMYNYIIKNGLIIDRKFQEKRKNKPYHTPKNLGQKWQMDVKYVPLECSKRQYYQYTVIDEATRERFIKAYEEHTSGSTVDFTLRAIAYFGYIPNEIQTDNGTEFTSPVNRSETPKPSPLDKLCLKLHIRHKLIKPRTPRHNGKVERSHRNDNERFYKNNKFTSFSDLQAKMTEYLERSNNIPSTSFKNENGKSTYQTPKERRSEILARMKSDGSIINLRLVL